ncbi:hypothetical protein F0344_29730 [Streptomyces finlayi]|uniref:Uncharacterized protein n=1 Tax=Streptomyces finlayi TaxID=67296 RepID=A0A7G7BSB0_9ACTN|nr:hypothetical protein [Streptomyces finlayi]QNE78225.1 hypothetical protein F0344_29730 [Streptomyces finlayi]
MLTGNATEDSLPSFWPRVREFAVPPSMIETATARRSAGDWAGACAAAGVDVDLSLRTVARTHGQELTARLRADLRQLVPDLLRWHLPRVAPHGMLRPGLTLALARYDSDAPDDGARPVHLVVRTPPAWADAGQRISLALWDGSRSEAVTRRHPHPHPNRRFRLDLHRHLWDARRTDELRFRSGADRPPGDRFGLVGPAPPGRGCAVGRWAAEADLLLRAEGRSTGTVAVRFGGRRRLFLDLVRDPDGSGAPHVRVSSATDGDVPTLPVLPDAATWVLPDLELLRGGAIDAGRLHPLVASALVPGHEPSGPPPAPDRAGQPHLVDCRGHQHRIGLVDGVLSPLDHDPVEIRREELLVALTGKPLPCLRAIDGAHRRPDCLAGVRDRLYHGDIAGALAVVEGLLGPGAVLRTGALWDELEAAAQRRITYGLFRAGLIGSGPGRYGPDRRHVPDRLPRPRRTESRRRAVPA